MSGLALKMSRGDAAARPSVEAMVSRLAARGPDGRGFNEVVLDGWRGCLGHAAHWVTPEDVGSHQPHRNAFGDVVLFDGRLDNRTELAQTLGLASTEPDAAFVLASFERWGEDCPRHLLGDFAFVIWNARARTIFGARDRLGLIGLYYHTSATTLHMASEQQALFYGELHAAPDLEALATAIVEEYDERGATLYRGVSAIEPGYRFVWRDGRLTTQPYWTLDLARPTRKVSLEDAATELRETLRTAVLARMRARGPVAIAVSGGLDSSSVAALAVSLAREGKAEMPVLTTSRYPGLSCDEAPFSKRLADHLGLPLVAIDVPRTPYLPPEPLEVLYDPAFELWKRMLKACEPFGVRALLTGIGSDELMWSTGLEIDDALLDGDALLVAELAGIFDSPMSPGSWRRVLGAGRRTLRAWRGLPRRSQSSKLPDWMTERTKDLVSAARATRRERSEYLRDPHPGRELVATALAFGNQSPFGIGQYVQFGPPLGVETRHPFFDARLVELVFSFPLGLRHRFELTKPLLRHAISPLLPPSLAWRTQGAEFTSFFLPAVFSIEPALRAWFAESRLESTGLVRAHGLRALLEAARADPGRTRELLAAVSYECWLRRLETLPSGPIRAAE